MHVHLIGVAGTGMGALAGLFREAGHRVTGSDVAFHPPMGPALRAWGVETMEGYAAEHLVPAPDLVVVGNVCRKDNVEARAAIDGGLTYDSMPGAIERLFLTDRRGFVVAGTHGKTTTTSLLAHVLQEGGKDPGLLVGGIPKNFDRSHRIGGASAPFVLEGDEYDSAFFEKSPKFLRYKPFATIITSIEHDHVDIYPTEASYVAAFEALVERIPEDGLLVAWAGCPRTRAVASKAKCRVRFYALDRDDTGGLVPDWLGATAPFTAGALPFDLFGGGSFAGRALLPLTGQHNARNAIAAIALATEGAGLDLDATLRALRSFQGVRRRQEWLGTVHGVHVYEDFAHHPTAVRETLAGLRERHPDGRVLAAFEPRSATASRAMHQAEYVHAFDAADLAALAPVGRAEISKEERLDVEAIADAIRVRGRDAFAAPSIDALADRLVEEARSGDAIVLMSNGHFGGIYDRVLSGLLARGPR